MDARNHYNFLLSLRAESLQNSINPFCKLSLLTATGAPIKRAAFRTSTVYQTENPVWEDKLTLGVMFGETNRLRFEIYGDETAGAEVIATTEISCASILRFQTHAVPLTPKGTLHVTAEINSSENSLLYLKLSAQNLRSMDIIGSNDPYFVLSRLEGDGHHKVEKYKSEVLLNNEKPHWKPATFNLRFLCDCDLQAQLLLEVFDEDTISSDFIGQVTVTVQSLLSPRTTLCIANAKGEPTGTLVVDAAKLLSNSSFIDHIRGGLGISLMVGLDFGRTAIRYHQEGGPDNEYTQALRYIGSAIEDFDSDRRFSVYGFGKWAQAGESSTIWDMGPGEVTGIDGVLRAYANTVTSLPPASDRKELHPLLSQVKSILEMRAQSSCYFILVLLTDGRISDLHQAKDLIIELSQLPLSIVIVGIGQGSFKDMSALDSDTELLQDGGIVAKRDIVQFANFSKSSDKRALILDLVSEIPQQVVDYMLLG